MKSKIYTQTGDGGMTSLVGGERVSKTHFRLEAYGTVDELNSFIGLLIEEIQEENDLQILREIQYILFSVGSYLATGESKFSSTPCCIKEENILLLEKEIDKTDEMLPKLNHFILPGGCKSAALSHICRTICRRAERNIYKITEFAHVEKDILRFINRLSDYFFILARKQCHINKKSEILWENPCK